MTRQRQVTACDKSAAEQFAPWRTNMEPLIKRVDSALINLAHGHGAVTEHAERAWASITFKGARHEVKMQFVGHDAVEVGELMIERLPYHHFNIAGQLVADAVAKDIDCQLGDNPQMNVTVVLLLLEEDAA